MSKPSTFCGLCGAPNPAGATVCVKCGALLAAYQAPPDPISPEPIPPAPSPASEAVELERAGAPETPDPEPTFADPGGASTELFGQAEIVLKPIELEPLKFEAIDSEPIAIPLDRPTDEPIEADYRSVPQNEPPQPQPQPKPSPKPEASRPVAVKVEPKSSDGPPIPPAFQPMFGSRPPSGKLFTLSLRRQPRWIVIGSLLLVLVSCVVITTGKGVGAALAFCLMTVALLGLIAGLIFWMRRKIRDKR